MKSSANSYDVLVLRFISGSFRRPYHILDPNRETIVGRTKEAGIVLPEEMVSRHHAKIEPKNGMFIVTDLGSTNGSYVNGEKIIKAKIREGDRILFGTSIFKVERNPNLQELLQESPIKLETAKEEGEMMMTVGGYQLSDFETQPPPNVKVANQKKPSPEATDLTDISKKMGSLSETSILDLLAGLTKTRRSGCLTLEKSGVEKGLIFLSMGDFFTAQIDGENQIPPMKAFSRICTYKAGSFIFNDKVALPQKLAKWPVPKNKLLDFANDQVQKWEQYIGAFDNFESALLAKLITVHPLKSPLSQLSPLQLEIFQYVYNFNNLQKVLNQSSQLDGDILETVYQLFESEFIGFGQ